MIYVDTAVEYAPEACPKRGKLGTRWAHLVTDGPAQELHAFAARMGLKREWFQQAGHLPHYDITAGKVEEAKALGARGIDRKDLCRLLMGEKLNKG